MRLDLPWCHAAIEIPAGIVFADMVEAESEIRAQGVAPARRTIAGRFIAARMVTDLFRRVRIGIESPVSGGFALHGV
ncbi:hypothetical protein GRO01_13160 [Gluconobacter roseus NBRC 3990]|uniref:Uncharacterized protein n=1 Tax=Gluconobacter roseus NBRC 3990 TaxID=1307950 RepID=A0A4Y3M366_9PROT|nr:hypothetical protein AA3990_0207 [Gluconobacter roseus NBRC 3990]GEB03740.1 hypothetical protein GRO01_13160 [Gluconobacter roseus NBRC 3990]GLP94195.1 hypothetical protein GCM10007871_21730 [Gluconobacter roseus NBRC 3990]